MNHRVLTNIRVNYCALRRETSLEDVIRSALATLFEEYVRSLNSPGAIPVVQSAWREVTEKESSKTLENAKSIYE